MGLRPPRQPGGGQTAGRVQAEGGARYINYRGAQGWRACLQPRRGLRTAQWRLPGSRGHPGRESQAGGVFQKTVRRQGGIHPYVISSAARDPARGRPPIERRHIARSLLASLVRDDSERARPVACMAARSMPPKRSTARSLRHTSAGRLAALHRSPAYVIPSATSDPARGRPPIERRHIARSLLASLVRDDGERARPVAC